MSNECVRGSGYLVELPAEIEQPPARTGSTASAIAAHVTPAGGRPQAVPFRASQGQGMVVKKLNAGTSSVKIRDLSPIHDLHPFDGSFTVS